MQSRNVSMKPVKVLDVLTEKYKGKKIGLFQFKSFHLPLKKDTYHYCTTAEDIKYFDQTYFTNMVVTEVVAEIVTILV